MRQIAALIALCAAACSGSQSADVNVSETFRPEDFVLMPCGIADAEAACALAIAGGKRVLFGTPAGIGRSLEAGDLRQLDAVMVFSLRSADLEGLDEVRNMSWRAGREAPLLVVGPEGTNTAVKALNHAFEQADALRIVDEGIPPGGYDAAILTSRELGFGNEAQVGFDTGDLMIAGRVQADGRVDYRISYAVDLVLSSCGVWLPDAESISFDFEAGLACETSDLPWPLSEHVMLFSLADG
ncbi:MAG: hypothetical protein AAF768_06265 [Pseudomonadota bacterium]